MAIPKQATSLAMRNCLVKSSIHILVLWFPAIPAGMTCFPILMYKSERSAWERDILKLMRMTNDGVGLTIPASNRIINPVYLPAILSHE
ncbi:MAG TPA: hypothetical protein VIF37_09380 [Methylobacter sp.]